jgi:outer membrane receptor protein involved in Fe transport
MVPIVHNSMAGTIPYWITENNRYTSDVERIMASTELEYHILPWLSIAERISIDTYTDTRKEEINVGTRGRPNGSMYDYTVKRNEFNSDFTVNMNRKLTPDIGITALIGNNINNRYVKSELLRGTNLNIPNFFHISNASVVTGDDNKEEVRLVSLFSQVVLDYKEYLYLTVTGRNDWSSTLPKDANSYFYPSVSLGFVFTDALGFFRDSFLSYGRLRGAISQIGSDAPAYSLRTSFLQANPGDGVRGVINYPFNGVNAYQLGNTLGNPTLKPEISTEYEIGADLRMFEGRARIDVAYYDRSTKDQIFSVPVSPATGYTTMLKNAGEIRNSGIELALGGVPVQTRNFSWDIQANFSKNTTEVVALTEGVENIYLGGFTDPQIRIMPEKNGYGVIWSNRHLRNEQGQILIDDDGYPLEAPDLGPIGNVMPDWIANVRTTLRYKGLSVSGLVDIREGGDVMNMDLYYTTFYGTSKETENRGSEYVWDGVNATTGEKNTVAIVRDQFYYQYVYGNVFENFVEDGSFIKLREITVAYTLPSSIMSGLPIQSATISATGRNLWIDTDFSYGDPEGSLYGAGNAQGFYHMVVPSTKSYSISLNLSI